METTYQLEYSYIPPVELASDDHKLALLNVIVDAAAPLVQHASLVAGGYAAVLEESIPH